MISGIRAPELMAPAARRRASQAKAASEDRSERTPRCVSEDRRRQRTDAASSAGARVAERAGFEPATGCPEPHFQCGAIVH